MHNFNSEDLETFLIQTELAHEKVKALAENRMTPEQFDKLQVARAEDKKRRQDGKKRKEKQAFDKKKLGREGKGITKDFQNFCRFCHRQYELPTPICARCNRNTMTLKQRQQQLEVMVNDYKDKKKKREERKMKWDMWQKTKAMLWKKTSNSYEKWDYFVSDSQQQPEKQPIIPKDDPNFKALERDMQQRKAMRQKDTKNALRLKQKGNAAMKRGDYQEAMEMYTLSLQHMKDIKSVYTNRALAYIKLGRFKKAIKDCSNVIQYMEVFEKVEQNKDLMFKAYLRRSSAKKERKQYKQALEDVQKALTFYPNDKSAEILKKQLQGFIQHSANVERLLRQTNKNPESEKKKQNQLKQDSEEEQLDKQKQDDKELTQEEIMRKQHRIIKELAEAELKKQQPSLHQENAQPKQQKIAEKTNEKKPVQSQTKKQYANTVQQIKQRVQDLNDQNIAGLFKLLAQKPELVSIFIAAKGIQKCLNQLINAEQSKKEGYLVSVCLRGDGVGEKQVWDFGIKKIHDRIQQILDNPSQVNMGKYFILQDIFQVLIPMSLHQKYRMLLSDLDTTYKFLQKTFSQLITRHKKQPDLFSSFLIYMGNLCSGNSKLRDTFINQQTFKIVVQSLYQKILSKKSVNKSHLNLKKNIYSLFANLIINQTHRSKLIQILNQKQVIEGNQVTRWSEIVKQLKYYPKIHENFDEYILSLLSVFTNVTLGTSLNIQGLSECINERYLSNPSVYSSQIIHRSLLTISRVKYENTSNFKKILKNLGDNLEIFKKIKSQKNSLEQIVRLLNFMYMPIAGQPKFSQPLPKNLLNQLKSYISALDSGQNLFCNTCNLFCVILDTNSEYSNKLYAELKPNIKFLIDVAKDKVGNWRRNAAILLGKLSMNQQCKDQLYKHHGMDVLKSIAAFVKQK